MYSKIKIFGHPLHAILVAFPIAFYTATFFAYLVYFFNPAGFTFQFAYTCNILGVCTALLAALPGFIDWAAGIPAKHPAKSKGLKHMVLNLIALGLFVVCIFLVKGNWEKADINIVTPLLLAGAGFVCTLSAGSIGGEMMQKDHVGIELTPGQKGLEPKL